MLWGEGKNLRVGVGMCCDPRDCLGSRGFFYPTQPAALPVIAGTDWSTPPCRISIPCTGGLAGTWVPVPVVGEKGTSLRCRCVKHRTGCPQPCSSTHFSPTASALAPAPALLFLIFLLGCALFPRCCPSCRTPEAHCQYLALLHVLSTSCYLTLCC